MMKIALFSTTSLLALTSLVAAHCQVPCGIYSDDTVFATMHTDHKTIAKAMLQINALSKEPVANANQIARWVANKEKHAQAIQDVVSNYFLAQRIKIDEADKAGYTKKLTQLHHILVLAMKCKQTSDVENAKKLHIAITAFSASYSK